MKLPTVRNKGENARVVKAEKSKGKISKADALKIMQERMGVVEKREIPMHCAKHDRGYTLVYQREPRAELFMLDRIEKDREVKVRGASGIRAAFSKKGKPQPNFDLSEFDQSSRTCPWCGSGGLVRCGSCGGLYCSGSMSQDSNGQYFKCVPSCGNGGYITNELNSVAGKNGRAANPNNAIGGATGKKHKSITGPKPKLLGGGD